MPFPSLLHGTMVLTLGRMAGYGLSFLRNLILARILAKADYGLASAFSMAVVLLEIGGRMSFGQQLIQSKRGDQSDFQDSAHALQFLGGVCSAVLIIGLSVPTARLFNVPQAWWAFAFLAAVPLLQGLTHLDIARRQREFDFLPLMAVDVVPQVIVTAAAWPLAVWLKDYRVIVWLMVTKSVTGAVLSFMFARRPYRWRWDREHARSMLVFGWPLLLNGLVMFGCQQADQVIVGAGFSLDVLASYSLAFSIVSIPWFILGQVGTSVMLPLMSRVQDDKYQLGFQYRMCAQVAAVAGTICTLPLMICGEQVVVLLYGEKYHGTGIFVALLGAAAAVRFLRFAPTMAALAKGDTISQLHSNLWRGVSLPLAWGTMAIGGAPEHIALCPLVAECVAGLTTMMQLRRRQGLPISDSLAPSGFVGALVSLGLMMVFVGCGKVSIISVVATAVAAVLVTIIVACLLFPELKRLTIRVIRQELLPAGVGLKTPMGND